jgi:hypothetical protein
MNYIFILDQSDIHIHSFFAALSVGLLTKNMGYVLASAIHHSIGFGNLLKVMMNSYSMRYSENSTEKDFLQLLVGIPLAFDSLYIAGCSQNMVTIEKMAIILVLFYMNGKINVFYNYSHLSFHVLVFLQNILLCSIISKLSYE